MSVPWFALAVAVVGIAVSVFWFGYYRRRAIETAIGVQALANMKWRECIGLVIESLHREGYADAPASRQPGDGGNEFILVREGETTLLGFKHGTAYKLGEANVRDFINGVQLQGAPSGILVTLGTVEGQARDLAKRHDVQLIPGSALWPRVEDLVAPGLLSQVREEARGRTRKGLWVGVAASMALGLATYAGGDWAGAGLGATSSEAASGSNGSSPQAAAMPATAAPAAPPAEDPTLRQINATAKALKEIENLTPEQLSERRAKAAKQTADIPQVESAAWSTQSTLVISLKQSDGKDVELIEEACRTLVQFEELRYSRLQLEPPPDTKLPVRWRQCQ